MTAIRSYTCDLCLKELHEGFYSKDIALNGIGIKWIYHGVNSKEELERVSLKDSEHHLCFECIENIKNLELEIND
jgi:hypothetical protein